VILAIYLLSPESISFFTSLVGPVDLFGLWATPL
jgi:hypothetical protein